MATNYGHDWVHVKNPQSQSHQLAEDTFTTGGTVNNKQQCVLRTTISSVNSSLRLCCLLT